MIFDDLLTKVSSGLTALGAFGLALRKADGSVQGFLGGSDRGAAYVEAPPDSSLTTLINNAALPAAGAFTTTAYHTLPGGTTRVSFIVKYTRHASATTGQAKKRILWKFSDTVTDVCASYVDPNSQVIVEPKVSLKGYCMDISGPKFTTTTPGVHVWTVEVPAGAVGVAMQLAEMSDTTNMGTVSQWIATSGAM